MAEYERWRDGRAAVIARASAPELRVVTATAWAAEAAKLGIDTMLDRAPDGGSPIEIIEIPGAAKRPGGARFGSLVHAVLATVPLDAATGTIARAANVSARLLNADAAEIHAAVDVVTAVLAHDLLARARASANVRRETPVAWVQKDGTLVEGVLDLAFDEEDRTIVIDFKTDHELVTGEARYRAQLQQYVTAVTRATGRPAAGVLFKI